MHRARGRAAWSGRMKSGLWSCCGVTPGSDVPWDTMGCHQAAPGQHRKVALKWCRRQGSSLDVVEDSGGGDPNKDFTGNPKWWRCEGDAGHGFTSPARALNVLGGLCDGDVAPPARGHLCAMVVRSGGHQLNTWGHHHWPKSITAAKSLRFPVVPRPWGL